MRIARPLSVAIVVSLALALRVDALAAPQAPQSVSLPGWGTPPAPAPKPTAAKPASTDAKDARPAQATETATKQSAAADAPAKDASVTDTVAKDSAPAPAAAATDRDRQITDLQHATL